MDEAAQQAVQLGVNITIFIVALSISLTLMLGVRDVAEKAFDYNAAIPTGSRVVSVAEEKKRIISGDELLSYYANYMTDVNHGLSGKFVITVENRSGSKKITSSTDRGTKTLKAFFKDNSIDISKDYEVITEEYNKENETLRVTLKEIE